MGPVLFMNQARYLVIMAGTPVVTVTMCIMCQPEVFHENRPFMFSCLFEILDVHMVL